jgi:hypothetical protein
MTFRIEHRIGVAAPAAEVWDLVYDIEKWPEWTELYTEAAGRIAIGEKLRFTFQVGDAKPMNVIGTVYDWVPETQLAWIVSFARGWVKSLRYVEIEKLSETSCILANGDYWSGPLAFMIPQKTRAAARAGFQRMNENAKRLVEAGWAAKGGQVQIAPDAEVSGPIHIQPLMNPTRARPAKMWGMGGGGAGFGPRLQK